VGRGTDLPLVVSNVLAAGVDPGGQLWLVLASGFTYVYDRDGEKTRVVQFAAAGALIPSSLSFPAPGRLLVTPGCYEFDVRAGRAAGEGLE
jgi:hypothetical protein